MEQSDLRPNPTLFTANREVQRLSFGKYLCSVKLLIYMIDAECSSTITNGPCSLRALPEHMPFLTIVHSCNRSPCLHRAGPRTPLTPRLCELFTQIVIRGDSCRWRRLNVRKKDKIAGVEDSSALKCPDVICYTISRDGAINKQHTQQCFANTLFKGVAQAAQTEDTYNHDNDRKMLGSYNNMKDLISEEECGY